MTNQETLELALNALKCLFGLPDKFTGEGGDVAVWRLGGSYRAQEAIKALEEALAKQEQRSDSEQLGEPWGHGGRPMTLRECMEAEEPQQGHSFTYAQMKEQVEGLQRDYDLLLAEYNLLKQEQGEPVAWGNLANWCLDSDRVLITDKDAAEKYHRDIYDLTPLYTTPQQRKPLTELRSKT